MDAPGGPRPKSETWPSAKRPGKSAQQPRDAAASKSSSFLLPRQPSRPPDQVAGDAIEEVHKLEAAVIALGGENSVHAKSLVEALETARAKSRVPPVSERLTSCRNFLERARKRVARAEDLIVKATDQRTTFVVEVKEAEERLKQLEAEVVQQQRGIEELVRERDTLRVNVPMQGMWSEDGPPSVDTIPPMPSSNLHELHGWLSDRNCELRNALESGDNTTIAKVGASIGTDALSSFAAGVHWWHQQIDFYVTDQADAKWRRKWCVRQARYGLRGVRIGEATNPGRPKTRVRPPISEEAVENILSGLEFELTLLESDDEPLVRPVDGRHVVPRIATRVLRFPLCLLHSVLWRRPTGMYQWIQCQLLCWIR